MKIGSEVLSRRYQLKVMLQALLIGLVAGLLAVAFHLLVRHGTQWIRMLLSFNGALALFLPALVYAALYASNRFTLTETTFGVRAVEYELQRIDRLVMKPGNVLIKMLNTVLALSCGFAVGQFGPTVHLGGAIGSNIGYMMKLPEERVRVTIGCGVAAAIAAVFHVPLFAAIFTIEVIFARRYFDYMLPVLFSALVAYGLDILALGEVGILRLKGVQSLGILAFEDWLALVLLAVGLGALAGLYVLLLKHMERMLKPLRGARLYGVLAIVFGVLYSAFPESRHVSQSGLMEWLQGSAAPIFLGAILVLQLLMTSVQLGSGVYGGNFSPGLILGILFGAIVYPLCDALGADALHPLHFVAFSMVGMISGFAHAPVSAVILAIEATGQASIVIPALSVALVAHFISDAIARENAYHPLS